MKVCIYHSIDLDGWMSAAIVKYFDKNCDFIGYNYGDTVPDLSKYDEVIMCDLSFPENEMVVLSLNKKFTWIDHHISAINKMKTAANWVNYGHGEVSEPNGIRDAKYSACELTWMYYYPSIIMPELVRLLGRYDCFGHKGTDEEQKVLEFQYGARSIMSNMDDCYAELVDNLFCENTEKAIHNKGKAIYSFLCTEAKQVYKNGFVHNFAYHMDNKTRMIARFICINKERFNPINFGIDYHKDGYDGAACFHFDGNQWSFSLYNDNGLIDCSVICQQYRGGGHKGAAGFRINKDDINMFL